MPTIGILGAGVFGLFALALIVPITASVLSGNGLALEAMLLVMVGYGFLSAAMILALNPRRRRLARTGVFWSAIVIWLSLIGAATPVFMLVEGHRLVPALFEATSASVTLGVTLRPAAEISVAMGFYRATVAWLGGLTTLMLAVYILGPYTVGGTPNNNLRLVQHAHTESDPRLFLTLRAVFLPYLALTVLCALALTMMRVPPPDAIVIAMSMLSTNGFVPHQSGGTVLNNMAAETTMMVFMVVGATSIIWHRMLFERKWRLTREHNEGILFLGLILIMIAVSAFASLLDPVPLHSQVQHVLNYAFDAVSIMTTTGITHDQRFGVAMPLELILLISIVGGCSFSTAGGLKMYRLGTMMRHLGNELNRLVYPNTVLKDDAQFAGRSRETAKAVWSAFFLAIMTLTTAIIMFGVLGYDLGAAMALSSGSFAQVGNMITMAIPEFSGGQVSDATLLAIAGFATLARIEILVFLAALAGNRW